MELREAIQGRRSIRGFTQEPISRETLRTILELAARAVSAMNIQPWETAVVTGEPLRAANVRQIKNGAPQESAYAAVTGVYKRRSVEIAKQLFSAMEITREDQERRTWWLERGYRFFDAPAAIILYMDGALEEAYRFDLGCFTQNICLAAMEFGLGTCVEYQGIAYPDVLREQLRIPESKHIVCGIAIGYPDPEFPANRVISRRADVAETTVWHGFPPEGP